MNKNIYIFILSFSFLIACNNALESPYPDISFEEVSTMPGNGRSAAIAFAINGKGYVALGRDSFNTPLKDCWEFDPASKNWTEKDSFPGTARVKAVAVVLNGKAYVGLGFNPAIRVYSDRNAYLKDFWEYEPTNNTWTQKDSFPSFATNACVSFVYKNEIFIGGGFNGYGFSGEFWKYSPLNDNWIQLKNFPSMWRTGSILSTTDDHIFYGTGYRTLNENDWWEYFPETDSWTKRKSFPDNGRENAVSININNRCFVKTGKHFGGTLTTGYFIRNILEYDINRDVWYERGNIPGEARENAISFTINGKGYIGFGDNDKHVFNDLWSFEP